MTVSRMLLAGLAAMGLVACTAAGGTGAYGMANAPPPATAYAHRMDTAEMLLVWNCARPEPGMLRLEGIAQNPSQAEPISSLQFELVGVDARGRSISEARAEADDYQIGTNQSSPFRLTLRLNGGETRFDLFFQYFFSQTEMDARLAGAPVPMPWLLADTTRYLIRDACSDTQHLAR